jgi:glucose/arabinose dehydrogenase
MSALRTANLYRLINAKQRLPLLVLVLMVGSLAGCRRNAADITVTPPIVPAATIPAPEVGAATPPEPAVFTPESAAAMAPTTGTPVPSATPLPTATSLPTATALPTATPSATATPLAQPVSQIELAQVASGFNRPTYLGHAFDERLFVVEQRGRIYLVDSARPLEPPFLNIESRVGSGASEQGLLSVAFHPAYADNGRFFVNYTNRQGDTVIARYQVSASDPARADENSEQVLMLIGQPYGNHNGGQIKFGPDGYLYIGMGDGGSGGDPLNHGQNPATLLGALLRIDVDFVDGEAAYAIPAHNPFVADDGRRNEIWAFGLRNPWRFSFDAATGDLFIADVGQNAWEEVNFQPAHSSGGENYGWNIMEGNHCFRAQDCDRSDLLLPVAEYGREGGCSITGGYVYRGRRFSELAGNYFFADYCTGRIWSLVPLDAGNWQQTTVFAGGLAVSSFGEDADGELYVLDHRTGDIYQIRSTTVARSWPHWKVCLSCYNRAYGFLP